jgi:hypothetical protein
MANNNGTTDEDWCKVTAILIVLQYDKYLYQQRDQGNNAPERNNYCTVLYKYEYIVLAS